MMQSFFSIFFRHLLCLFNFSLYPFPKCLKSRFSAHDAREVSPLMDSPCLRLMGPAILLKLGGALLTIKSQHRTLDKAAISTISSALIRSLENGNDIIVVLGAGSFGHTWASHLRLSEGRLKNWTPPARTSWGEDTLTQEEGVNSIRTDLDKLRLLLVSQLEERGASVKQISGRGLCKCDSKGKYIWHTEELINFPLNSRSANPSIFLTGGDVINHQGYKEFSILSGDEIMRYFTSKFKFQRAIFAMNGIDGLLSHPPEQRDSKLITEVTPNSQFVFSHDNAFDVTGGILSKVKLALEMATHTEVIFVNGCLEDRLVSAISCEEVIGTKILPFDP